MTSEIRANKQTNRVGLGTVEYTNTGIIVSGIVTCTELSGLTALSISGVGTANALDINGDIDVDGHTNLDNVSIAGVTTTGAVSWGGHMLPTSNAAYDIGSADYKVRHLFLSDNSLKFVDSSDTEHPLSVDSGRLKFAGGLLLGNSIKADVVSGILTATKFVGALENSGDFTIDDWVVHAGDTNTKFGFPSNDNISFEVAGVERLRIDNVDGVVAKHTTAANLRVQNSTAAASQVATLDMAPANGLSGVQLKCTSEEDFSTGANRTAFFTLENRKDGTFYERLRINSSGQMGLGGTPTHKLEIFNAADTENILMIRGADTTTEYAAMGVSGGNAVITGGGVGGTNAGLVFRTAASGNEAERLRITSGGKVGIGSDNPNRQMTIVDGVGGGIGVIGTNAGIYMGTHHTGGFQNNAAIARAAANNYHISGSAVGDLCIAGESTADIIIGTSVSAGAMAERLRITSAGAIKLNDNNIEPTGAGGNVSTAYDNAGWEKIVFDASYNTSPIGPNKIILQNDNGGAGWYAGFGIASDELSIYSGGNTVFYQGFNNAGAINESLRITTDGKLLIGTTNTNNAFSGGDDLIIGNTNSGTRSGITLVSNSSEDGGIYFSDGTSSGNAHVQGQIVYDHTGHYLRLYSSADEKVRILGGTTDNVLQIRGGNNLSISDFAPNQTFSGTYNGWHVDNHGNCLIGLNAHLHYSSNSGTHQWKQTNAHSTIGSAGMFIGGNGSNNNSNITFFRNGQGSSAGTVFSQDSWKFQIGSAIRQNFNLQYLQRGYFKGDTNQSNANNFPLAASGIGGYTYGYQEAFSTSNGSWVHPYPDIVFGYHTGMRFGAYPNYGGCRFYNDHPSTTSNIVLSVGNGNSGVHVTNTFTAGSNKGFRIAHPHPSKKYTHDLVHNALEGPQMDLVYRGKVDLVAGSATVNIDTKSNMTDGTFVLLNRDIQCFTSNETGWTAVKGSVSGNILTITAQDNSCTDTISWMVVGERQDDKIKASELTTADGDLIVEPLTIEETHM